MSSQESVTCHSRRNFVQGAALLGASLVAGPAILAQPAAKEPTQRRGIKLGFDNFSIRAMNWNAEQLLDHAHKLQVDSVLFSNLGVYRNFEETYLKELKTKADELGIDIQAGTNSICPTSGAWNDQYGDAKTHLELTLRVAHALGSPVARCYLGNGGDRKGEGGIQAHIAKTIEVCRSVEGYARETGVKIAIENHAGDMQAWELADLIERAGPEFVGATMDSGNATWTIESPAVSLEILGPYAATTGIRDSAIWQTEGGATVQWVNMGDGVVDWPAYLDRYKHLCPGVTFQLEIISGGPREFNYYDPAFWEVYPKARASDFAEFVELAQKGGQPDPLEGRPTGATPEETAQIQQLFDLEKSVHYCKEVLGLGLK
jgi:sugar phosphate isomerase/epimerase